jgi:hypothetical protein
MITPIDNGDLSLVEIQNGTPHCKIHGAMNKVCPRGTWRCISSVTLSTKFSEGGRNLCRAGCFIAEVMPNPD